MTLLDFWRYGATLGAQPFSYFGTLVSLSVFLFVVYIMTALKQVLDNKNQRLLW